MNGTIRVESVPAPSLQGNPLGDPAARSIPVYLPPGYEGGRQRYPAVYFLHGFSGSGLGWIGQTAFTPNVPERIDALIDQGAIPPFIAVFVDGWTRFGGSQYVNSEASGRYRDYVARDVVGWADRTLRTLARRESRAVVGKSSGGYGAFVMAAEETEVFAHVGAHAGDAYFEYCYLPDFPKAAGALLKAGGVQPWFEDFLTRTRATRLRGEDHPVINTVAMAAAYSPAPGRPLGLELPFEVETGRLRDDVFARWLERDPVRFIPARMEAVRTLKSFFVDCGTRDEFHLRWGARMVVKALAGAGVPHLHEEFEDGHMGINYRYDRSLGYLVPRLAAS
ncbi:MAG TPA: alpha/beta hydrolase-fold protein [Myxococcales bacterium]|nr:alpha/beta hydrolase-fold protein [Myxococcales bacterium]